MEIKVGQVYKDETPGEEEVIFIVRIITPVVCEARIHKDPNMVWEGNKSEPLAFELIELHYTYQREMTELEKAMFL